MALPARYAAMGVVALLLAASPPAVSQSADRPTWEILDPAGDQSVNATIGFTGGMGTVPLPSNPIFEHVDLRGVAIHETELGLNITFKVQRIKYVPDSADTGTFFQCGGVGFYGGSSFASQTASTAEYRLLFERQTIRYAVNVVADADHTPSGTIVQGIRAYVCLTVDPRTGLGSSVVMARPSIDEANNAIHVFVPKDALLGRGTPPPNYNFGSLDPRSIPPVSPGDKLQRIAARTTSTGPSIFLSPFRLVQDQAPNAGYAPDYELRMPTPNQAIRLQLPGQDATWPVAIDRNQTVTATVTNTLGAKRILLLSYGLEGANAADYSVHGPATITIPGSETRNFTLAVNVPPTAKPDDDVRLLVRGVSAGYSDEIAADSRQLAPSPLLDADRPTLYLHSRFDSWYPDPVPEPIARPLCAGILAAGACYLPFLSPFPDDKAASQPDRTVAPCGIRADGTSICVLPDVVQRTSSPLRLPLDTGRPVVATIKASTSLALDAAQVTFFVSHSQNSQRYSPSELIAQGTATTPISTGGTTFNINAPITLPPETTIPAGTFLRIRIEIKLPAGQGMPFGQSVEFHGGDTKLDLPLLALPPDQQGVASASPLQLAVTSGAAEFINPGEARRFNVTLLNQDTIPRDAHLAATTPEGWSVDFQPGADFVLKPGDTIRLGVLVRAPPDTPEGTKAPILLNATTPDAPAANLRLTVVATRGVDLEDDTGKHDVDPDAKQALAVQESKKSPPFGPALAFGVLALAACFRRRRNRSYGTASSAVQK